MSQWEHLKKSVTANLPTVIAAIAVIAGILFVSYSDYRWIGHAIIGLTAFSFLVITVTYGAILAGKIRRPRNPARFRLHRKSGITMGYLVTATLAYGFGMVIARAFPLLDSVHGRVGLIILALAITQIIAGFTLRSRKSMNFVHRWNGYFLIGLTGLQVILGILLTPVLAGETPRYALRLLTPPVEERWATDGVIGPREYFFKRVLDDGNYEVSYRTDGKYIYTGLKVKTTGWVGIGISSGQGMLNADIVFAYVNDRGEAVVEDHFGISTIRHLPDTELGGTNEIVEFGGKREGGYTMIEFKRPIVTDDKFDVPLVEGVQKVIWAYGLTDSSGERHAARGTIDIVLRPR